MWMYIMLWWIEKNKPNQDTKAAVFAKQEVWHEPASLDILKCGTQQNSFLRKLLSLSAFYLLNLLTFIYWTLFSKLADQSLFIFRTDSWVRAYSILHNFYKCMDSMLDILRFT